MSVLLVAILGVLAIAAATTIAPRIKLAGPLLLLLLGVVVGLLPFVSVPEIDPEIILVGILPPLLYSAAVALPAIEFRRDFGPIAGLSFLLVVVSAFVLAGFFLVAMPGVVPQVALAVGAILSPTDAVATSIVRRLGVSRRVVTMLEGESLLNDATSLVLFRAALIAATAGAVSLSGAPGIGFLPAFVWGVVVAVVIGGVIGYLALRGRAAIGDTAANTAVGLVVPFMAYLPTEELGGSGLVAAVVAGIITGQGAARWFTPQQRMSDEHNWRMIELLLEGTVFLLMGLELRSIVEDNLATHAGLGTGLTLAACALTLILVVRALYVSALVWLLGRRAHDQRRERLRALSGRLDRIATASDPRSSLAPGARRRLGWTRAQIDRAMHDIDYYQATPLGWRHGVVIVWAGMRGVVTLAAAQTLPRDPTVDRSLLVFVAFMVAAGSLVLQGLTLPWVIRRLELGGESADPIDAAAQAALDEELRSAALDALADASLRRLDGAEFPAALVDQARVRIVEPPPTDPEVGEQDRIELRLALIGAMRRRLSELAAGGTYSSAVLRQAFAQLDADQLSLELRLERED